MRYVVLDTETTGLEVRQGHRIIEIGCIEVNGRQVTDHHFHQYINPEREVDEGAFQVHGISDEMLADKPKFKQIAKDFLDFVQGSTLIIHNASFDIGFLDGELERLGLGKMADYAFFYLGVAWHLALIKPKPDRIVALTTPPYLSILARFFSKLRGGDHAHWVMDLYPDVMVAHGMLSQKGLPARFLEGLARWGFGGRRSKMVLTLGPDMETRTARYLSPETPREWVPLWGTAEATAPVSTPEKLEETKPQKPVVLMYSGNMGLGHRFDEFLAAAASAGDDFLWKFHGQGKRRAEVEKFLAENPGAQVTLGDYVPREELAAHLAAADVHLASLDPVWDGTMVPSKLQGIFAIGRPVIFVGSRTCAMGTWILESGGGWVVPPDDPAAMQAALQEARVAEIRNQKGKSALNFAERCFGTAENAERIAYLLTRS